MARAELGAERHVAVAFVIDAGLEGQSPGKTVVAAADELVRHGPLQASDGGAANDGCLAVRSYGPSQTQMETPEGEMVAGAGGKGCYKYQ